MRHKLSIGTANFTQPYGVLSQGKAIPQKEVKAIFESALIKGIIDFDTAFGYGDLQEHLSTLDSTSSVRLVSKFSILDDYDDVYDQIKSMCDRNDFKSFYGLLVHDPQNIAQADKQNLTAFFDRLKKDRLVQKVGVSVYDLDELKTFNKILPADLVQIPLNPFNQVFLESEAQEYLAKSQVEVHARSLFLQGVLLADALPAYLDGLRKNWERFNDLSAEFPSKLEALLWWANSQSFVTKWVLGVSSKRDLDGLAQASSSIISTKDPALFSVLSAKYTPLVDPRNWDFT
mgnify:CR=1 FL=1|tara:strand:- start:1074 stop:1937 length:864 start_codon:yes stop_codon:yes gene_type:complete